MSWNRRAVVWFAAIVVVVNGFFPAVWILLTSFKTETELLRVPITFLPDAPTVDNYVTAFTAQPILRFMQVWGEPFTRLRLPKIYNLRTDPYEFADVTSNSYYEWFIYHAYILYGAYALADKFAATFKDFPIIQKPNTFTIGDAIAMMKDAAGGGGK